MSLVLNNEIHVIMVKIYVRGRRVNIDVEPSTHLEYDIDRVLEEKLLEVPYLTNKEKKELIEQIKISK